MEEKRERKEEQGLFANWFLELLSSGVSESQRVKREIKRGGRLS